jgi:hypothetical protein
MLYDGFRKEMGGQQELDKFARLFMPNTSELLLQIAGWVENGQAPESIVARQGAGGRGRALTSAPCRNSSGTRMSHDDDPTRTC